MDWLTTLPIAHRGLHDKSKGIIENSTSAFAAAITAGYAIECDVRLSQDGEAMVFHDAKLDRVTAETGQLIDHSAREIAALTLAGSSDRVQTLAELLEQVAGAVPILIEIKSTGTTGPLEARTAQLLHDYKGEFAVQSFNPFSMRWFAGTHPNVRRGQISGSLRGDLEVKLSWLRRFALRNLLLMNVSKPHFISYEVSELPTLATSFVKRTGHPLLAWVVKSDEDRARTEKYADNMIFMGFCPPVPNP